MVSAGPSQRLIAAALAVLLAWAIPTGAAGASTGAAAYRSAVLADGPVSYWRLDEKSGDIAHDQQPPPPGGRNPGQIHNADLDEPGPMAGDASMRFNGDGDVNLGHDTSLLPTGSWTVELWFRSSRQDAASCGDNYGPTCQLYATHAFGFSVMLGSNGKILAFVCATGTPGGDDSGCRTVTAAGPFDDGKWHHLVVVRDPNGLSIYVDGGPKASVPTPAATTYYCCEDIATIANDDACGCFPLAGWESEVAFYDHPLTADRIAAHYRAAGARPGEGGGAEPARLLVYPVQGRERTLVHGTIGLLTVADRLGTDLRSLSAAVRWGDGRTSRGALVDLGAGSDHALGASRAFKVVAAHKYDKTIRGGAIRVHVRLDRTHSVQADAPVLIYPRDPQAYFIANPSPLHQDGIGLLMPAPAQPGQRGVVAWQWDLGDDYNRIRDDSDTHPMYVKLLDELAGDPGNGQLRRDAIAIGILPQDANGNVAGVAGLSSDQVLQLVRIWQQYFPQHVVPVLPSAFGQMDVRLTIKDGAGNLSSFTRRVKIARDCLPWGGPLKAWFNGYTTCDTYNGIAVQVGPHRSADYVTVDLSKDIAAKSQQFLRFLNSTSSWGAGVSLTFVHGVAPTDRTIFVTVHLSRGVGITIKGLELPKSPSLTFGWVGPPDPDHHPSPQQIDDFVSGPSISGGFTAGIGIIGGAFTAIYNPGGDVGEELTIGAVGLGGAGAVSCSLSLATAGDELGRLGNDLTKAWHDSSNPPSKSDMRNALVRLLAGIVRSGVSVGALVYRSLGHCVPGAG